MTSVTDGTTSVVQGADLQTGQRITTGADGRAHLMFNDGSAVTVGPNSALRIDNYTYDPASKTGAMTLDVQQGTIRFVGGAISKKADVQIRTPSSTIGLRGGIAAVSVGESGATNAEFLHGSAMRVTAGGLTQTATHNGSQISVPAGGQPASPTVLAPGRLANMQALDRAPTSPPPTSRATRTAVDEAMARSGLGSHGSALPRQPAIAGNLPLSTSAQQARQEAQSSQIRLVGPQPATMTSPIAAPPIPVSVPVPAQNPPIASPVPTAPVAPIPPRPQTPTPIFVGGGQLTKVGAGTLILVGSTYYSSSTTISAATLKSAGSK